MATLNVTRARAYDVSRASRPGRRRTPLRTRAHRHVTGYLFLAGALFCFGFFSWYPIGREIAMSFQADIQTGHASWVGMANFRHITNDTAFWTAWKASAEFTGLALVLGYAMPFAVAVAINEFRHLRGYFRLLVYLPVMMPPVAAAVLWKYFYTPGQGGMFNAVLHLLHLPMSNWTQSPNTAVVMLSLVLFSTWSNMGGATLVYLAALQDVPGELYESAELAGAGLFRKVWHVTIPQTRLILSLMFVLQVVATMQVFMEPFVLTGGGPEGKTTTVVFLIYEYAFHFFNYGGAAALSVLLLAVLAIFGGAYIWLSNRADRA